MRYGNKSGFVSRYGKEHYVALAAAGGILITMMVEKMIGTIYQIKNL